MEIYSVITFDKEALLTYSTMLIYRLDLLLHRKYNCYLT